MDYDENMNTEQLFIFLLFIIGSFFIVFFILYSPYSFTDKESAIHVLVSLIEVQAISITILITLSVLAIQAGTSLYSHKALDEFIRSKMIITIIFIFILSIVLDFWLLKSIDAEVVLDEAGVLIKESVAKEETEIFLSIAFKLGIICFLLVIPFILELRYFIVPIKIINKFTNQINKNSIVECQPGDSKDPIKPIIDIIIRSSLSNDESCLKPGLNHIEEKLKVIYNHLSPLEKEKLMSLLFFHLSRIYYIIITQKDNFSGIILIKFIENFGLSFLQDAECEQKEISLTWAIESIGRLGVITTNNQNQFLLNEIIKTLKSIALNALFIFNWNEIPKRDKKRFLDFITRKYNVFWAKAAVIEEIENNRIVHIFNNDHSIFLVLNNKKTEANIVIDDGRIDRFKIKGKNDELIMMDSVMDEKLMLNIIDSFTEISNEGIINNLDLNYMLKSIELILVECDKFKNITENGITLIKYIIINCIERRRLNEINQGIKSLENIISLCEKKGEFKLISNALDDIYGISLSALKYDETYNIVDISIKILSKFNKDKYRSTISSKIINKYLNNIVELSQLNGLSPRNYEMNRDLDDSEMPIYG